NSWGSDAQIDDYSQTNLNAFYAPAINAFRSAVEAGQVLVFAAGNDSETSVSIEAGLPLRFSELESGWLAVTALSSSGSLASFANACGSAAAWCVAAPGYGYATRVGGGYGSVTGTSPATAYVAGALAALQSAFPTIALGDIRGRLLSTADDSVGSAVETGQGLIDLGAALNPVGEVRVTTTSGGGTGSLTTGGALGTAGLAEVSVTALDSLGFPFQMAIDGWIQAPMKSARSGLRQWQLTQAQVHSPANGFQASAVASRTGGLGIARLSGDDIGQWLRPVRWGAPAQAHPALVGWGESWVIQHQGGAIESYSAQDTDQHQRLGALRYQGQHGWLETSVHHEDAGYLGVRSDLIQLPSTTTHWLGMGLRTGGLSVSGWYGNTTRGDQVSAFDASLALGEWTLNIQQPARVEAGAVTVGVSTPGTVLGQVDWTQQVVSTVPDGREQRFGVTRWLGAQRGWHGFVRADAVHDAGHRAGVRDHELSAGVLRRF
ncbi:MAG: S8 family serine peptidase, partial [Litorivicinus sp.]